MAEQETALVTGATGFIGSHLCRRLQEEGWRVIALGRRAVGGSWDAFVEMDLTRDEPFPKELEGVHTVYHLASLAHALSGPSGESRAYHEVIVEGTRRMVAWAEASQIPGFVYMSSVKAMGEGNPGKGVPLHPMDESWPSRPEGPYGQAKAAAEREVREANLAHGVVLRPTLVYGPGEKGNIPRMMGAVRQGRFPPIPELGNRRSMIHVADLVEFTLRAARQSQAAGGTYILTSGEAPSTRQLYDMMRRVLSLPPSRRSLPGLMLKGGAVAGSMAGLICGRKLSLNLVTLEKLTGSAWYSAALAESELGYVAKRRLEPWLKDAIAALPSAGKR